MTVRVYCMVSFSRGDSVSDGLIDFAVKEFSNETEVEAVLTVMQEIDRESEGIDAAGGILHYTVAVTDGSGNRVEAQVNAISYL